MPQTTREEVEITALIRGILNGYPGNSAILREYLQNSDDAKASKQASCLGLLGLWATNVFIALIDFYPKGLHTRRTNSPFRKYLGSLSKRGPRTGLDRLQRWRATSRRLEGPSNNSFFQQKNRRGVSFLFVYFNSLQLK